MTVTVSAFYKFVELSDPPALRIELLRQCAVRDFRGSILLAPEGINGTISGDNARLADFFAWLRADPRFADIETKESSAAQHPFKRMKVRLKREIVTFGVPEANPARSVGTYVAAEEWNALVEDPDTIVIDTRNAYEAGIGTFRGAIDPQTRAFHEFPGFVREQLDPRRHTRVAMFCTGGIRCEKASSYMLQQGFKEVYQLRGGILKYLETMPPARSLWQGECFVFDERVALKHGLEAGSHGLCERCGMPVMAGEACARPDQLRCLACKASNGDAAP